MRKLSCSRWTGARHFAPQSPLPPVSGGAPRSRALLCSLAVVGLVLAGCGRSAPQSESVGSTTAVPPPAASLDERPAHSEPPPRGPAALIAEIARLRTLPDTVVEVRYENGARREETSRPPTEQEMAAEQQRRLERTIELAAAVIKDVHADPEQEQLLNNAIHYLTDARLQLALLGHEDQAEQLSHDAETLFERDPTSLAAVESGYKVVQLAESMAARHGAENRAWVRAYANQARLFAERFPQEQGRAAVSLIAAGRRCEQFQLQAEARQCYLLVEQHFPDSAFTAQIAGILRRLRLEGHPLELAGPTIDGGFLSVDQFAGRPMLVVFWATGSESFRRDLPVLKQISSTYRENQLTVVGINLDEHESAVDAFLEEHPLSWRQIFFSDPAQRAGRNPVARYYGVHVLPCYWLVDAQGIVVAAPAAIDQLPTRVAQLVAETPATPSPANDKPAIVPQ